MPRKVRDIRFMAEFYQRIVGNVRQSLFRAMIRAVTKAELKAKQNVRDNFKGTKIKPKTGNLMNAIFSAFEAGSGRQIGSVYVAVRSQKGRDGVTRPYGRVHEYGSDGPITPKKAKNLWIPQTGPKSTGKLGRFKNVTPSDLVGSIIGKKKGYSGLKGSFSIFKSGKGNQVAGFTETKKMKSGPKSIFHLLFVLKKEVKIRARPYVTPAMEAEYGKLSGYFNEELKRNE